MKGNPIGWCTNTINVNVGCTKCSPGCAHCYAESMAKRLAGMRQEKYQSVIKLNLENGKVGGGWNGLTYFDESAVQKPFAWKKPRTIFVNSMGDTFHEGNSFRDIDRVMKMIAANSRHKFIILTKRPLRMAEYFSLYRRVSFPCEYERLGYVRQSSEKEPGEEKPLCDNLNWPLKNLALGVTAENQEMADLRIPILLQIPAAVRFVSIEPMLGPVDISKYLDGTICMGEKGFDESPVMRPGLDWVIVGGENGPGARPMSPDWVYGVRDACLSADIPFYFKGWGLWKRWPFTQEHENKKYITIDGYKMVSSKLHIDHLTFNDKGDAYQYKQRPAGW